MLKLDGYTPRLLQLMRAKGGAVGSRIRPLLDTVNEVYFLFHFLLLILICRRTTALLSISSLVLSSSNLFSP